MVDLLLLNGQYRRWFLGFSISRNHHSLLVTATVFGVCPIPIFVDTWNITPTSMTSLLLYTSCLVTVLMIGYTSLLGYWFNHSFIDIHVSILTATPGGSSSCSGGNPELPPLVSIDERWSRQPTAQVRNHWLLNHLPTFRSSGRTIHPTVEASAANYASWFIDVFVMLWFLRTLGQCHDHTFVGLLVYTIYEYISSILC